MAYKADVVQMQEMGLSFEQTVDKMIDRGMPDADANSLVSSIYAAELRQDRMHRIRSYCLVTLFAILLCIPVVLLVQAGSPQSALLIALPFLFIARRWLRKGLTQAH